MGRRSSAGPEQTREWPGSVYYPLALVSRGFHTVFVPGPEEVLRRVDGYWRWVAVVVFLLIPMDMLTTLMGQAAVGTAGEANPLMRWALEQGLVTLVIVNVLAATVVVWVFHGLIWLLPWMSPGVRRYFGAMLEAWIAMGLVGGVLLLLNNLAVFHTGRPLELGAVIGAMPV